MPEFRTDTPEYTNEEGEQQEMSSNNNTEDICGLLGLADIHLPRLIYSPLPLQCLAAEALPGNIKEEIEQLTKSSISEVKRSSGVSDSSKRDSTTTEEEVDFETESLRENVVSVPVQFFSNGMGLRLVGGVKCVESGEVHAQIVFVRPKKKEKNISEQIAALDGHCVMELNGESLKGASFEMVRKLMKGCKDILINLTVKDCKRGLRSSSVVGTGVDIAPPREAVTDVITTGGSLSNNSGSSTKLAISEESSSSDISLHSRGILAMQSKRRLFNRRLSIESLNPQPNDQNSTEVGRRLKKPQSQSMSNLGCQPPPPKETSGTVISVVAVASPVSSEEKSLATSKTRKKSVFSLDSPLTSTPIKKKSIGSGPSSNKGEEQPAGGSSLQKSSLNVSSLMEQYSFNMPKAMIQLGFNYVKTLKTLYISLFKVKYHSITVGSENSGCFYNTYIFPDNRCQGVKYAKIISSTLTTEDMYSRSASYILTEQEIKHTSIRILVWEQTSQPFGSKKKHALKGEVFLDLNDDEFVNLHGVPQLYTICDLDPNLPALPKAVSGQSISGGGTLVRKMMDTTIGTLKRKKKKTSVVSNVTKADSLVDLSDDNASASTTNISRMLEPLKNKPTPTLELPARPPSPPLRELMIRPATIDRSDDSSSALIDFLSTLGGPGGGRGSGPISEGTDSMASNRNSKAFARLGLPPKSPMFSSYHELRPGKEESNVVDDRRASVLSDGDNSVSYPATKQGTGSLLTLFNHTPNHSQQQQKRNSKLFPAESCNSMISCESELSLTQSSVSIDRSTDGGSRRFQSWSDAGSCKFDQHSDSISNMSLHSIDDSCRKSDRSVSVGKAEESPIHNSIVFEQSLSPTDSMKNIDSPDSSINDGSYSCEQIPIILTSLATEINGALPPSSGCGSMTNDGTTMNSNITEVSTLDTVNATSESPQAQASQVPLPISSTPLKDNNEKKSELRASMSLGNVSEKLFFLEVDERQSFGEFVEKELSCFDISNMRTDYYLSSQSSLNLSGSQREALECSGNSSSLDFSVSHPSPSSGRYPNCSPVIDKKKNGQDQSRHRTWQTSGNATSSQESQLLESQKSNKWSSMDDLKGSNNNKKKKSNSGASAMENLLLSYENGKSSGSTRLKISAKCVLSQITVDILDAFFFNAKLMNAEFEVRVNLFNRVTEHCEKSLKGRASIKKDKMNEMKDFPPTFVFSGNPTVYYLQLIFQVNNKVFGKKQYHVLVDIRKTVSDSYERTDWFHLNKLS